MINITKYVKNLLLMAILLPIPHMECLGSNHYPVDAERKSALEDELMDSYRAEEPQSAGCFAYYDTFTISVPAVLYSTPDKKPSAKELGTPLKKNKLLDNTARGFENTVRALFQDASGEDLNYPQEDNDILASNNQEDQGLFSTNNQQGADD